MDERSGSATSSRTVGSGDRSQSQLTVRVQLFPHSDRPHQPTGPFGRSLLHSYTAFSFSPVEKDLVPGSIVRIGRKVDRHSSSVGENSLSQSLTRQKTRRGDRAHNVANGVEEMEFAVDNPSVAQYLDEMMMDEEEAQPGEDRNTRGGHRTKSKSRESSVPSRSGVSRTKTIKRKAEFVAFRSKVVSRTHAEMWVGKDGKLYFRDIGSSSGTFLNRLRLSNSGSESSPYVLKNGDVVQLGVDYQGRAEEIYKCVMFKIFITVKAGPPKIVDPRRLKGALENLITAMNPSASSSDIPTSECCICLNNLSPLQSLFLAPCSHCFHYKCVTPLLGSGGMFLCPMCRQVANLDANVADEENAWMALSGGGGDTHAGTTIEEIEAASGRVLKKDVDENVKRILQEAECPIARVTAHDLDALADDADAAEPESPAIKEEMPHVKFTAPPRKSSFIPPVPMDIDTDSAAAILVPELIAPPAEHPSNAENQQADEPLLLDDSTFPGPRRLSWSTTLVRPTREPQPDNSNTDTPAMEIDTPASAPSSSPALLPPSTSTTNLHRNKTQVNPRRGGPSRRNTNDSLTKTSVPAVPTSARGGAVNMPLREGDEDENSRLRALLASLLPDLGESVRERVLRDLPELGSG
ncbi:uncharacterized protein EV422DRAFT_509079 [Fimicolochytrium jonesii]|uniref:uncharacterized protein n=1 Tax=Fimicolochytrium jonesii TaxID=1396493 RepID=UPI0022FEE091|nr:uncharacterized protein EV422DRAFT_509079 [Fimicolochytrium jonesii]KAI8817239.1 hypothetical protein EV422DRAFT_509079 [Fimicolochytrium jonesii]